MKDKGKLSSQVSGARGGGSPVKGAPAQSVKNSQVTKVKNIESKIHELLQKVSKCKNVSEVKKCTVGGVEKRIDNITMMTEKLSEAMSEIGGTAGSAQGGLMARGREEVAVVESSENTGVGEGKISDQQRRRVQHKIRYRPLDVDNLQEVPFNKYFIIKFSEQSKRQINPYAVINKIEEVTGNTPKSVTGNNRLSFTAVVRNADQSAKINNVTEVGGFSCEVQVHSKFCHSKGIIYIKGFEITDIEDFKSYLQENYPISDISPATFIKTRDPQTQAFLITFNQEQPPYSLYIPGERQDTLVYQYRNKPLICHKCQQYGHSQKWCKAAESVCRRCSNPGHTIAECVAEQPLCIHCKEAHMTGSRECERQIKEEMLIKIQDSEKVGLMRARQILENNNEYSENVKEISHSF